MYDHPLLDFGERCALAGFVPIADRAELWERIGASERACSPEDSPTEGVLSIDGIGPGRWDGWRGHIATVTASMPVDPADVEAEQAEVVREMTVVFGDPHVIRGQEDAVYRWRIDDWTVEVGIDAVERNRVELTVADRELLAG
ncbi:hypothetical protein GA0111570_10467 [Raineyella antarctica]|uniref:Uncharacterized protein n=1 Tax=Raineyella antarctica TaxID=1577474 RepID=A0A1G6GLP5_9ACTN|nr:hypothetical protein [Raineyella antarctica]SDB82931.1 hypothetical protein GA0111570_10467 [Raineyella antarctica]